MTRECITHHHACDCREVKFAELEREAEEQSRLIEKQAAEIARLRQRIESAPVAIMDTRDALAICAPTEEDFPALYALQGKRVRLVVEDGE
jgi:hypothetical protein